MTTPGDPNLIRKGDLTFLDNVIDRSTGTIAARVTLHNADSALLPGQYVRVKLLLRDQPDALMAPQVALGSNQMGKFVYVVSHDDKAELRQLELGPSDGTLVNVVQRPATRATASSSAISRRSARARRSSRCRARSRLTRRRATPSRPPASAASAARRRENRPRS